MRRRVILFSLLLVTVSACASKEVLLPKPATVPAGLDLSGEWLLRESDGVSQPKARQRLVHVFLETGESVKVTQTRGALFVSFDRSVVEEYRFGEHRDISVGEISAERVSGWVGDAYVVETLDKDGAKLVDRYSLAPGGEALRRSIVLTSDGRTEIDLEQVFDRAY